jgi:hypothetical protein
MKSKSIVICAIVTGLLFLSSCEIELRDGHSYPHAMGWEHRHNPSHHDYYNHRFHHDKDGNEIVGHPQMGGTEPGH